jgi:hypothetical protein
MMFEGFTLEYVDVGEVTLRVRHGGQGPPVVLLHGHPRTHTTWHRVARSLAGSFFVVCRHRDSRQDRGEHAQMQVTENLKGDPSQNGDRGRQTHRPSRNR